MRPAILRMAVVENYGPSTLLRFMTLPSSQETALLKTIDTFLEYATLKSARCARGT
jgi:hypothetical protein